MVWQVVGPFLDTVGDGGKRWEILLPARLDFTSRTAVTHVPCPHL
jgi:hypothetical protein